MHPRRSCEPGEHHYHGCLLHDMEEERSTVRNSASPINRSRTPSSQYSSLSSLNQRRQRNNSQNSSHSTANLSNSRSPSILSNKRYSIGAYPHPSDIINQLFVDVVDSPIKSSIRSKSVGDQSHKEKSKSTICLRSSSVTAGENGDKMDKRGQHSVTFKCYDSPDQIIANLFPGIDKCETKYLRKGHGAAQMARNRSTQRDWPNLMRSTSAIDNYSTSDMRKLRSYSTSSDNSANSKDRFRSQSNTPTGRLFSVERDFDLLWWVIFKFSDDVTFSIENIFFYLINILVTFHLSRPISHFYFHYYHY